jgi:hypothetical protein
MKSQAKGPLKILHSLVVFFLSPLTVFAFDVGTIYKVSQCLNLAFTVITINFKMCYLNLT